MISSVRILRIDEEVSENLVTRESASTLFHRIDALKERSITIDFSQVKTISRSFAHQYAVLKLSTDKKIEEIDVPLNVAKMFNVVREAKSKLAVIDINKLQVADF